MNSPRTFLLIGHRGVGKTSLIRRIKHYYKEASREVQAIDLDQEIEARQGRTISDIFNNDGEEFFRELERFQLKELLKQFSAYERDVFIALGAGFQPDDEILNSAKLDGRFVWIRRETDKNGRVFLNRPRLDSNVSPLKEYLDRFEEREARYRDLANLVLTLPEGLDSPNEHEAKIILGEPIDFNCAITVDPKHFVNKETAGNYVLKRKNWNIRFEIRDDLFDEQALKNLYFFESDAMLLWSFRPNSKAKLPLTPRDEWYPRGDSFDWALELGTPPEDLFRWRPILSLHNSSIETCREKFSKFTEQNVETQKLAVRVNTWKELQKGHQWWSEDPDRRAFLPMSDDGRWNWYRLWLGSRTSLNFVREGFGSASDQPTLLQWLNSYANDPEFRKNGFAAVLGDPVAQSRTPMEQQEFFAKFKMPVLAGRISKEEWAEAFPILRQLGLRAAAVTAPLKELAFQSCNETSDLARTFESVNTLVLKDGKWIGENTDLGGFQKLAVNRNQSAVIWGGGGTLEVTRLLFPKAHLYSAQTGEVRPGSRPFPPSGSPNNLIWSVGRTHYNSGSAKWPPEHWRPSRVIDLNYTDDSPGLEYAAMVGANYVSGLAMFEEQARLQREFWSKSL